MIENKSKMLQPDEIKEIPYGVSDFTVMRDENLYYVDKSMYIPTLENEGRFCSSFDLVVLVKVCLSACLSLIMTAIQLLSNSIDGLEICG